MKTPLAILMVLFCVSCAHKNSATTDNLGHFAALLTNGLDWARVLKDANQIPDSKMPDQEFDAIDDGYAFVSGMLVVLKYAPGCIQNAETKKIVARLASHRNQTPEDYICDVLMAKEPERFVLWGEDRPTVSYMRYFATNRDASRRLSRDAWAALNGLNPNFDFHVPDDDLLEAGVIGTALGVLYQKHGSSAQMQFSELLYMSWKKYCSDNLTRSENSRKYGSDMTNFFLKSASPFVVSDEAREVLGVSATEWAKYKCHYKSLLSSSSPSAGGQR